MRIAIYTSNKGNRMKKAIETGSDAFVDDIKLFFSDDADTEYLKPFLDSRKIKYILEPYETVPGVEKFILREKFSDKFLEYLKKYEIDYVFCNGMHLFSGNILNVYKNRIINFHGALLPSYPDCNALDKMLNKNEFLVGTTAMFIDEGVDTGPIIMEAVIPAKAFYIKDNDYDIVLDTQVFMMHKIYDLLKSERIKMKDGAVYIEGVDYTAFSVFPQI